MNLENLYRYLLDVMGDGTATERAVAQTVRHFLNEAQARPVDAPTDAERLDWMERQDPESLVTCIVKDAPGDGDYFVHGDHGSAGYGRTFRDAIDAAMRATPAGGGEG